MPPRPRRRVARKFVHWVPGHRTHRLQNMYSEYAPIFHASEKLFDMKRTDDSRFIFLGMAMRPLFETIRGLNEQSSRFPRNDFRYFVSPPPENISEGGRGLIDAVKRTLIQRHIVTKGKSTYYLVDYRFEGRTFRLLSIAIKEISPNATIHPIDSYHLNVVGRGIQYAEGMKRPTVKEYEGGKMRLRFSGTSKNYMEFQYSLQEWLKEKGAIR